jgi:hypothetical protein
MDLKRHRRFEKCGARGCNSMPLTAVCIIGTAQSACNRVVGAARFSPGDYIPRPFDTEVRFVRIYRAAEKRGVFLPAYRLREIDNLHVAICYCAEAEKGFLRYQIDFMRLGLAETSFMRKRYAEASENLRGLIRESNKYLYAQD